MGRKIYVALALFTIVAVVQLGVSPIYAAKPALLFILDGQSNASPHGNGDLVSQNWKQVVADTLMMPKKYRPDWIVANPYPMKNDQFNIDHTGFGPELTFIKSLKPHFPNHILAIAQDARGGSSIIAWDKNYTSPTWRVEMEAVGNGDGRPPQYPELMELKNLAVATLNQREDVSSVTLGGMLWVQNEQDVGHAYGAQRYETNLRALVRNVRADWGVPRMPFMFVNSHTHDGNQNAQRVDAAVAAVQSTEPNTAVINTKDLGTHDETHFNTSGTVELGIRFANAFMNIYDANSSPLPSPSSSPRARPSPSATPRTSPTPRPRTSPSPSPSPSPSTPTGWDLNSDGKINAYDFVGLVKGIGTIYNLSQIKLLLAETF